MNNYEHEVINHLKQIINLLEQTVSELTSLRVNVAEIESDTEEIVELLTPPMAQSATLNLVHKDPAA